MQADTRRASDLNIDLASLEPAQIEQVLRERLERERDLAEERRWEGVPETARLWLALAPPLPRTVANRVGLNTDLLDRLAERGAVQVQHPRYMDESGGQGTVYAVQGNVRERVLTRATADAKFARHLIGQLASLGAGLLDTTAIPALTGPLERWAQLASRAESSARLVEYFDDEIEGAAKDDDAGCVLGWIETARPLAALLSRMLDPALDIALHRAGRRLELLHRHEQDRRHLRTFLDRAEPIDALRRLVDGPDDQWALHLFGSGGVGKTMLLRHLVAEMAPRQFRSYELPTARIDFDYLSADYPRLAPGLLLWSFGQELRRYADREAIDRFSEGDRYLRELHQHIRAGGNVAPTVDATRDHRFIQAVALYIAAMRSLPQPVILVLDTCEELAKIRPDGTVPENVRATFRILEALHDGPSALHAESAGRGDGLPSLRVVFAGRRPLASAGAGWRVEHAGQTPRPYLALHELRGFTGEEANRFLSETVEVPPDLIEPILDATRQSSGTTPIVWIDPARATADVPRYNPYDLRLYADWATEDPPPDPDVVRHATAAQYVELRILQRLDFELLERIMPALALVKHIDAGVVSAAGAFDEATTHVVFEQLAGQEWIELRRVSIRDGTETRDVLTVAEGLRRSLVSYYDERGGVPSDMARRVADHLQQRTLADDLGDLDWSTFDAALRAFELDGTRGAHWWPAAEARMIASRGYRWLREITGALVAEDNAAGQPREMRSGAAARSNRLRAAVLASYASSLLRSDTSDQIGGVWQDVLKEAERVPEPALARRLRWRAAAGLCACHARKRADLDRDLVAGLIRAGTEAATVGELDVELGAALLAGIEAVLEYVEGGADPDTAAAQQWLGIDNDTAPGLAHLVEQLCNVGDPYTTPLDPHTLAVRSFASALAGRLAHLLGQPSDAHRHFEAAFAMLHRGPALPVAPVAANTIRERPTEGAAVATQPGLRFADWIPPEDLASRIRLEALRALPDVPPDVLFDMVDGATDLSVLTQDAGRFFSARLRTVIALAVPDIPGAGTGSSLEYATPQCNAHRWAPAVAITYAEALAARGHIDDATRALRSIVAQSDRIDFHDLQHAERALLRIAFRYRLGASDARSVSLAESRKPEDRELVWASREFDESRHREPVWPQLPPPGEADTTSAPVRPERLAWLRAAWRTRMTLDRGAPDGYQELLALGSIDDPTVAALHLEIAQVTSPADESDSQEELRSVVDRAFDARWLDEGDDVPAPKHAPRGSSGMNVLHPQETRAPSTADEWVADLSVLAQCSYVASDRLERRLDRIASDLGARRSAEIALFEADLLALRLPERAQRLYEVAHRLYDMAGDRIGSFLAEQRLGLLSADGTAFATTIPDSVEEASGSAPTPDSAVPALAPLRDLASGADWSEIKSRWSTGWVPTMERAAVTRAARTGEVDAVIGILTAEHPRFPSDGTALPADLIVAVRRLAAASGQPAGFATASPASAGQARRSARGAQTLSTSAIVALSLAFLAFVLGGGFFLFRALVFSTSTVDGFTTSTQIGIYLGTLFVLTSIVPWLVRQARSGIAARARLRFTARSDGVSTPSRGYAPESVAAELDVTRPGVVLRKGQFPRIGLVGGSSRFNLAIDRGRAYQEQADRLPKDAVAVLTPVTARLLRRSAPLIVQLGGAATAPCWEGIIAYRATPDMGPNAELPLRVRRVLLNRSRVRPAALPVHTSVAVSFATDTAEHVVRRGWNRNAERGAVHFTRVSESAHVSSNVLRPELHDVSGSGSRGGGIHVLHLVGTVVETNAGLRFRQSDATVQNATSQNAQWLMSEAAYTGSSVSSSSQLLASADIERGYAGLVFCILQGEPVRKYTERLDSDRVQAELARAFAAELHMSGLPIVLVLPPLTPDIAADAVGRIDSLIMTPERMTDRLDQCVLDVQRRILRAAEPKERESWERAFDVCLYVDDDQADPA